MNHPTRWWTILTGLLCRCRASAAFVLASLLFITAAPASAQSLEDICENEAATELNFGESATRAESVLMTGAPGRGDDALALLRSARATPRGAPGALDKGQFCLIAGEAMRAARLGSGAQAKRLFLAAYSIGRAAGSDDLAARAAVGLGFASAEESGSGAAAGVRSAAVDQSSARSLAVMRNCAPTFEQASLLQADFFVAAAALECASATALAAGNARLAAIANLRLARMNRAYATDDARERSILDADTGERLGLALSQALLIADPGERAAVALRVVETMLLVAPADPAIARTLDALQPATLTDPALEAYRLAMMARRAAASGDSAAQVELLSRAIASEYRSERPLQLANWYVDLAEARPAGRGQYLAAAYRALESARPFLPQLDPVTQESTFQLRIRDVFEKVAGHHLSRDTAGGGGDISAAQTVIERYRQAELQAVFGSECVPTREPLRPANLAAGEIILYPVLLDDRVELLYAAGGGDRFERITSPVMVGRAEVTRLAEAMVAATSTEGDAWREPARRLFEIVIAPVLASTPNRSTLIVIPDGPLRSVPFAALVDGEGRFLVESIAIAVAPALGFAEPGRPSDPDPAAVLAVSLSREVVLPAGSFPRLEGTREEAAAAAGTEGVLIEDFRKADLERTLSSRRIDVLHMSTHASFNGRADRAFIVANGEAIRLSELRDMVADNQLRGNLLDLLVLAACETAVGDDQASMGLAGAAVQAGAASALASLWQVNDLGTGLLMRSFYDSFRQGASKAAALRDAQLSLIRSGNGDANPNVWSAFVLLGGWR